MPVNIFAAGGRLLPAKHHSSVIFLGGYIFLAILCSESLEFDRWSTTHGTSEHTGRPTPLRLCWPFDQAQLHDETARDRNRSQC